MSFSAGPVKRIGAQAIIIRVHDIGHIPRSSASLTLIDV